MLFLQTGRTGKYRKSQFIKAEIHAPDQKPAAGASNVKHKLKFMKSWRISVDNLES